MKCLSPAGGEGAVFFALVLLDETRLIEENWIISLLCISYNDIWLIIYNILRAPPVTQRGPGLLWWLLLLAELTTRVKTWRRASVLIVLAIFIFISLLETVRVWDCEKVAANAGGARLGKTLTHCDGNHWSLIVTCWLHYLWKRAPSAIFSPAISTIWGGQLPGKLIDICCKTIWITHKKMGEITSEITFVHFWAFILSDHSNF